MRDALPQLTDTVFLADSGLETDLIFHDGFGLPEFAAFVLLDSSDGMAALTAYYRRHALVAADHGCGIVLESPTWRASRDWLARIGYPATDVGRINRSAIALIAELRRDRPTEVEAIPLVISGCVGPREDGYAAASAMSERDAEDYHGEQLAILASTECDMAHAMTLTYAAEAVGIARAAAAVGLPVAISFTTETDGRLPDGSALGDAVRAVDDATGGSPAYYGVNCAHPAHFASVLPDGPVGARLRCIRANASKLSHAEIDAAPGLDDGDPAELASDYQQLRRLHPHLTVFGGCCGTDVRHVRAAAAALVHPAGGAAGPSPAPVDRTA
jgi:homocysteine S-methyltransferase